MIGIVGEFCEQTQTLFKELCSDFFSKLTSFEVANVSLNSERQTYIRFNNSKVRQSTFIEQNSIEIQLQANQRSFSFSVQLSGHFQEDRRRLERALAVAREQMPFLPIDLYQVPFEGGETSYQHYPGRPPEHPELVECIAHSTAGSEFTGLSASGSLIMACANSRGKQHWFSSESFFVDYSLYTVDSNQNNKSVKGCFAGHTWEPHHFIQDFEKSKFQLTKLKRASLTIKPDGYRVYLAPNAVAELIKIMNWGGLSQASYRQGRCGLAKLAEGKEKLSSKIRLVENFKLGLQPRFSELGDLAPIQLKLIEGGRLENSLVSSRTAKEYNIKPNGASMLETARSLDLGTGSLKSQDILKRLHTGVYISNLHYCNWSDLLSARVTGMTRYACFWVEEGEIVAPIADMRFDESFYRLMGSELEDLGDESFVVPNVDTYFRRDFGGVRTPGILVNKFHFKF